MCLINFAGFPATTSFFPTFFVTTAPAPINAPSDIFKFGKTLVGALFYKGAP